MAARSAGCKVWKLGAYTIRANFEGGNLGSACLAAPNELGLTPGLPTFSLKVAPEVSSWIGPSDTFAPMLPVIVRMDRDFACIPAFGEVL